jgi:hypothetical protein
LALAKMTEPSPKITKAKMAGVMPQVIGRYLLRKCDPWVQSPVPPKRKKDLKFIKIAFHLREI